MKISKGKQRCFSKFQLSLKQRKTLAEKRFGEILRGLGLSFKEQKGLLAKASTFSILDFYLPRPYQMAIEIDGGYHDTEEQKKKDLLKEKLLKTRRIHLIRFKNEAVLNHPEEVEFQLLKFMESVLQANKSHRLRKNRPILLCRHQEIF